MIQQNPYKQIFMLTFFNFKLLPFALSLQISQNRNRQFYYLFKNIISFWVYLESYERVSGKKEKF
ncbi:hypothetical protein BpHYR1_021594 [Brachionus plicatilis]|uniref:Uncharacterized protein n=1 Tax=Brachionus plicatilis TaxID=10195 RepID=A0A3M7RDS3_BRAPC|nr:hypothetical protein BpHYR1_021594 [Brachionus plicatilis]